METRIGQLLFGAGLLAGLLFAAPYAPWDELRLQVVPALADDGGILVAESQTTPPGKKGDAKQAAALRTLVAQLAVTDGLQVWPSQVKVSVQDTLKDGSATGLEVVFEVSHAAKTMAVAKGKLDLPAPAVDKDKPLKGPRVHATATAPLVPPEGEPVTFDQFLARGISAALYSLRQQTKIPVENLLPGTLFPAPTGPCDPATANGLAETGVDQTCSPVPCPEGAEEGGAENAPEKACGTWAGMGKKPAKAFPDDATAAFQWKIARALRKDFGSAPKALTDAGAISRLRGDFAQTKKAGAIKAALYKAGLPKANARLAQVVRPHIKGKDRDAILDVTFVAHPAGTSETVSATINKPFPSTSLYFWIAMAVAGIGCVLWRVGKTKEARANAAALAQSDSMDGNPFALLRSMIAPTRALASEIDDLTESQIMLRVDELLSTYVLPFGDVRAKVTETLGMSAGAEILVVVAYGERMLNRAWTAASDGHAHESRKVFPDVVAAFEKAQTLAEENAGAATGGPSGAPTATGAS